MMPSKIAAMIIVAVALFLAASVTAKSTTQELDQDYAALIQQDSEVSQYFTALIRILCLQGSNDFSWNAIQLGAVPDDGSVETALLNQ